MSNLRYLDVLVVIAKELSDLRSQIYSMVCLVGSYSAIGGEGGKLRNWFHRCTVLAAVKSVVSCMIGYLPIQIDTNDSTLISLHPFSKLSPLYSLLYPHVRQQIHT